MTDNNKSNELPQSQSSGHKPVVGIWWWAMLVIAVLAVPSFGFIASLMVPSSGYGKLIVFILSCWLCTCIGMRLMHWQPKK